MVSRRAEMFGGLAKNNTKFNNTSTNNQLTTQRSRHLSEANLQNVQSEKLIQPDQASNSTVNTLTPKNIIRSKSSAMLSLPPNINSPLTTPL